VILSRIEVCGEPVRLMTKAGRIWTCVRCQWSCRTLARSVLSPNSIRYLREVGVSAVLSFADLDSGD
jgi:hypothetical protein